MRNLPALRQNCLLDSALARRAALCTALVAFAPAASFAQSSAPSQVGLKRLEYLADGNRHLALAMSIPPRFARAPPRVSSCRSSPVSSSTRTPTPLPTPPTPPPSRS